jgi:hypothetical protein
MNMLNECLLLTLLVLKVLSHSSGCTVDNMCEADEEQWSSDTIELLGSEAVRQ